MLVHRVDAGADRRRVVAHDLELDAGGQRALHLGQALEHRVDDRDGVGAGLLADREHDRALAVVAGELVGSSSPSSTLRHVADADGVAVVRRAARCAPRSSTRRRRGPAMRSVMALRAGLDAAARGGQVLRRERALHVDRAQVVGAQLDRIHAHVDLPRAAADDRHLADAGDALDLPPHALVGDLGDLADRLARSAARRAAPAPPADRPCSRSARRCRAAGRAGRC